MYIHNALYISLSIYIYIHMYLCIYIYIYNSSSVWVSASSVLHDCAQTDRCSPLPRRRIAYLPVCHFEGVCSS